MIQPITAWLKGTQSSHLKLRPGRSGERISVVARFSSMVLGPTQPILQWVTGLYPGGKAAEVWCWTPISPSTEVTERVQLYFYSSGPSRTVLRWTFYCHQKSQTYVRWQRTDKRPWIFFSLRRDESNDDCDVAQYFVFIPCSKPTGWTIRDSNSGGGRIFLSFSRRWQVLGLRPPIKLVPPGGVGGLSVQDRKLTIHHRLVPSLRMSKPHLDSPDMILQLALTQAYLG